MAQFRICGHFSFVYHVIYIAQQYLAKGKMSSWKKGTSVPGFVASGYGASEWNSKPKNRTEEE